MTHDLRNLALSIVGTLEPLDWPVSNIAAFATRNLQYPRTAIAMMRVRTDMDWQGTGVQTRIRSWVCLDNNNARFS
jgi:hypothetical protein